MSTKLKLIALASVALLTLPATGQADTIDFGQFTPDNAVFGSPLTGSTTGGHSFSIYAPLASSGFQTRTEGSSWTGTFVAGTHLVYDGTSGTVTLIFSTPISALTLAAQANATGFYTETMTVYSSSVSFTAGTLIDTAGGTGTNCGTIACEGTAQFLTLSGSGIVAITISATNDVLGIGIAGELPSQGQGEGVPEPASLSLLGAGLLGLGAARRKAVRDRVSELFTKTFRMGRHTIS